MQQVLLPYILAVILNDNKEVLLEYRKNTEWFPNQYGLIGGKIDDKEYATEAMIREIYEEIGVRVNDTDVKFSHVMHFMGETRPCLAFFFTIKMWQGEIYNAEKIKHDHLKWFPLDKLPENMIPRHKKRLGLLSKDIAYSEDSWDKVAKK